MKAARLQPCWLCGQDIDYDLPHGHPMAFQTDHVFPVETHPALAEDPANQRPAHARCNQRRGPRPPAPSLGVTSRDW